jgi:hypothetical protein
MKNLINILVFSFLQGVFSFAYSQIVNDTINREIFGDPMPCFYLDPDEPIRTFDLDIGYNGKIVIEALVDTTSLTLYNYKIVFANLYSTNITQDTVIIRNDYKSGNFDYIESIKEKFIHHISYIKLIRIKESNCVYPSKCISPIKIKQ